MLLFFGLIYSWLSYSTLIFFLFSFEQFTKKKFIYLKFYREVNTIFRLKNMEIKEQIK